MTHYPISIHSDPFTAPQLYRNFLFSNPLVAVDPKAYSGKSLICIFFTRYCGVGCPFCFFKSAAPKGTPSIEGHFSDEGIDRFITFANAANAGYLLVSGGGEPLNHRTAILRTIAEVKTERIVLVTSGSWAMSKGGARKYVHAIKAALEGRETPCYVTVRISISVGHAVKLGTTPIKNLIGIFEEELRDHPFLRLQVHAFENDPMLDKVLDQFEGATIEDPQEEFSSDDPFTVKVIPKKLHLRLPSGYTLIVGVSKVFKSGLRPNLNEESTLTQSIEVFERDLIESEDNNSAIVENLDGQQGLDWAINYNGNTCTWQNQVNDFQFNLYEDEFSEIFEGTLRDPLTLSYIENGRLYRENVVAEVSPRSVLRVKSISLRDYSGAIIFEQEKVRLYYTIRAVQDYLEKGRVDKSELAKLPKELLELINLPREKLIERYHSAKHTIIDQYLREEFDSIKWKDLFELIKLGHYDLSEEEIKAALKYYNSQPGVVPIPSLDSLEYEKGKIETRLTERLMHIKPMACMAEESPKLHTANA